MILKPIEAVVTLVCGNVTAAVRTHGTTGMAAPSLFSTSCIFTSPSFFVSCVVEGALMFVCEGTFCGAGSFDFPKGGFTNL